MQENVVSLLSINMSCPLFCRIVVRTVYTWQQSSFSVTQITSISYRLSPFLIVLKFLNCDVLDKRRTKESKSHLEKISPIIINLMLSLMI